MIKIKTEIIIINDFHLVVIELLRASIALDVSHSICLLTSLNNQICCSEFNV